MRLSELSAEQRRDMITWAYRLFLGREPESEEAIAAAERACDSLEELRAHFLLSVEFVQHADSGLGRFLRTRLYHSIDRRRPPGGEVVERIIPRLTHRPERVEDSFFYDFMGTRARIGFLPASRAYLAGRIEPPPAAGVELFHDNEEWFALLRTLAEAEPRGRLVVAELGAGWGPWLAAAGVGARHLGIGQVALIGVEADAGHVGFMRQNVEDNSLTPLAPEIHHAVIGTTDGTAFFPRIDEPAEHWGQAARYPDRPGWWPWRRRARADGMVAVRSISLASLLRDHPLVDLLHVDIQGAEGAVLSAAAATLDAKVRRISIGTHARDVEQTLLALFGRLGWVLEDEAACEVRQAGQGGVPDITRDGVQVWRNPKL